MIIVMKPQAVREEIGAVVKYIEDHGRRSYDYRNYR